jgi:hypothetical protein
MLMIVGGSPEDWGIIPSFLNEDDPRSAKEQIHSHYMGGWNAFQGFTFDPEKLTLKYPDDPLLEPLSALLFRNETLLIYQSAWVVILQKDGSWEVARLD